MSVTMDGDAVSVGDQVFDVVYGVGTVAELLDNDIVVSYASMRRRMTYNSSGVLRMKSARTLYWRDPILVAPAKADANWSKIRAVCMAVVAAFRGQV